MFGKNRQERNNEQGVALLVSLFLVVLMTGIVIEVQDMIRGDIVATAGFQGRLQARQNAETGLDAGKMLLMYDREEDWRKRRKADYIFDATGLADMLQVRELWSFFTPQGQEQLSSLGMEGSMFPLETGAFSLQIEDLSAKVNLNRYYRPRGLSEKTNEYKNLLHFMTLLGLEDQQAARVTDSLLDWLDTDDELHPQGAESGVYNAQTNAYEPRNGPLMAPDELRAIYGVDDVVFAQLTRFVTAFPGDERLYSAYKINVNTAPAEVLAVLDQDIGPGEAEAIVAERTNGPYMKTLDLQRVIVTQLGLKDAWNRIYGSAMIDVRSDTFHLVSSGLSGGSEVILEEVIRREDNQKFKVLFRSSH